MRLGIYKPYKKVFFGDDSQDLSAVSYEVVNVAKIFAERGHEVTMLSPTDLNETFEFSRPEGITQSDATSRISNFDRIFIFSGTFAKDKMGSSVIPWLRLKTPRLDFILTDLRLTPSNTYWKFFNNVYTQATRPLAFIPEQVLQQYGGVSEFYLYHLQQRPIGKKDIRFGFCGTERGRLQDIKEYIDNSECQWIGKSQTFNFDTRVPRDEFKKLLDRTKYSITIADEEYNTHHFITPRPYEHAHHQIINFIDDKFDPDGQLEPKDSWFRVRTGEELFEKMSILDANKERCHQRLHMQSEALRNLEFLNGNFVYECLDGGKK